MKQKDIKQLWGRAANRCSICRIELALDSDTDSPFLIGEQAHIVGESEDGPRGLSDLTKEQRNSYENMILLCPNHHTEIDKNEKDWSVERLHRIKTAHESWISTILNKTTNGNITRICKNMNTMACMFHLEYWDSIAYNAFLPAPSIPADLVYDIDTWAIHRSAYIYPQHLSNLKTSIELVATTATNMTEILEQHAILEGSFLKAELFYKSKEHNNNYDEDLQQYVDWRETFYVAFQNLTKSLNWWIELVRQELDDEFLPNHGNLVINYGGTTALVPLYSEEEKMSLLQSGATSA